MASQNESLNRFWSVIQFNATKVTIGHAPWPFAYPNLLQPKSVLAKSSEIGFIERPTVQCNFEQKYWYHICHGYFWPNAKVSFASWYIFRCLYGDRRILQSLVRVSKQSQLCGVEIYRVYFFQSPPSTVPHSFSISCHLIPYGIDPIHFQSFESLKLVYFTASISNFT